jgi:hypothetical protein
MNGKNHHSDFIIIDSWLGHQGVKLKPQKVVFPLDWRASSETYIQQILFVFCSLGKKKT